MPKHDWNSLANYIDIHEKTIRFYHKWMEVPKVYKYEVDTEFHHFYYCSGIILNTFKGTRVRVDIEKDIEIDPSNPKRVKARTHSYTYSANIRGAVDPLIRYCSPHGDWEAEASAPHHKSHHKHDFTQGPKEKIILLGDDEWPHVGEFFEEVLSRF